jgi:hypothetical protein
MNATINRTEWFTEQRLNELSKQDNTVVYHYTQDPTVKVSLTLDQIKELVHEVRARYMELQKQSPSLEDEEHRHRLCCEKFRWKEFAKSHSALFVKITDKTVNELMMTCIMEMFTVEHDISSGKLIGDEGRLKKMELAAKFVKVKNQKRRDPNKKKK